ncbi:hypothetical protein F5141DRAFT_1060900 [Pisolithus sp. B1]|nr:hypothetical protein F5141DRAFT_1060900 [Pisolithus sp. B1]
MLELMEQWPTPLASVVHYAMKAHEAVSLAESLSGVALMTELCWLNLVICPWPLEDLADNEDDSMAFEIISPEDDAWGPKELLLGEVLEGCDDNEKEGKNEDQGVTIPVISFLWKLLHIRPGHDVHVLQPLLRPILPQILTEGLINISTNSLIVKGDATRHV